ncbi:hypothetical protein SALWKB12_0090 [Snodgrassella communis]|nr:hypothetical protein SALWKB12_0090 [Snodgrassella communis]
MYLYYWRNYKLKSESNTTLPNLQKASYRRLLKMSDNINPDEHIQVYSFATCAQISFRPDK